MKRKIIIELIFSDLIDKNLLKKKIEPEKFIGELVSIYRKNVDTMILPLKEVDKKIKVRVYSPKV